MVPLWNKSEIRKISDRIVILRALFLEWNWIIVFHLLINLRIIRIQDIQKEFVKNGWIKRLKKSGKERNLCFQGSPGRLPGRFTIIMTIAPVPPTTTVPNNARGPKSWPSSPESPFCMLKTLSETSEDVPPIPSEASTLIK